MPGTWAPGGTPARALLVFLGALAYLLAFHRYSFFLQDEGVIAYQALRVYQGERPYADFQTAYTPGAFYLHALLFDLLGPSLVVLRGAGAVAAATTAALLFAAATQALRGPWTLLPSVLYLLLEDQESRGFVAHVLPYPARYVEALWAASLCLTLAYARRRRPALAVALGLVTGAMIGFKHTSGIYEAWAVGLCIVLVAWRGEGLAGEPAGAARSLLAVVPLLFGLAVLAALPLVMGGLGGLDVGVFLLGYLPLVGAVLLVLPGLVPGHARARPAAVLAAAGADLVRFGVAALVPTAIWLAYFAAGVGPELLFRRLVLDGPSAASVYAVVLPPGRAAVAGAAVLIAAVLGLRGLSAAGALGPASAARALAVVVAALAAAAAVWALPALGLVRSGAWDVAVMHLGRELDTLAIYLVPVITYTWLAWLGRWLWTGAGRLSLLLCGAHGVCQLLVAFPRADIAHVYQGVVILLIPGTALLAAAVGFVRGHGGRPRWPAVAVAATVGLVLAVKVGPRLDAQLAWRDGPALESRTPLGGARGGLYGTGTEGAWFGALNRTVAFLGARTRPDDAIFTYPALPGLYFLSGRRNAAGIDYFYRGFGEGRDEVRVVEALEAAQVPVVVVMSDHAFDPDEREHFPVLKDYLARHFAHAESFPPFRVLERVAP